MHSQEYKENIIQLNLGEHAYKEMIIRIQGGVRNGANYDMRFAGSQNEKIWGFRYPDSLYAESRSFTIDIPTYNDTVSRRIGFKYINNNDTLWNTSLIFANCDTTLISATFLQTDTISKVLTRDKNGNPLFKDVLIDFYLLTSHQDKELLSSIEATQSQFYRYNVDSSQYDIEVEKYIDLARKYPDSHSLIEILNSRKGKFNSKTDVKKVLDCFSTENRNSPIGKEINRYVADTLFSNSTLTAWDTDSAEAIVLDSTKYNLVVFSASWCVPCIEEIPLLKRIYNDLSDKLDITYVSIDDSTKTEAWRRLMREENIPWRSVLAAGNINYIREKYFVSAIPYCLFVHPGGVKEPVEIRQTKVQSYLYRTIKEE
ncbi:TlpA family protein disulfide reductase [Olivibacter sp. SDN3]|uniref:TlpA family protein disulfide reductase n=1 Tax=Olivibacter sp. SDN3 TaxID=2764720 RepID=UPI00165132FD|nr:TlpA disulfide reductase family protein [Olivibacter sp. SDN3]QNL49827.1 TlpA family protein disulfide reductase [Olivibacter sp. SDN3]